MSVDLKNDFYTAIKNRRSVYAINKEVSISPEKILDLVNQSVKHAPSAFNSQSGRVLLLLNEHHDNLWELTKETLRKIVPPEHFGQTEEKINSFKNGFGTVLFFEDQSVIKNLQDAYSLYKDNFPVWSQHSSGMLQYIVWTTLELEGLGASLQHYSPLIDSHVRRNWNIPEEWSLIAQMPFGNPVASPDEKEFLPLESRVKFFK